MDLEQVRGSEHQPPHHREFIHNPIDIAYSSSHEDHKERGVRVRSQFTDNFSELKIEPLEFDGNLNWKTTLTVFKPLRGSLKSRSIMMRNHLSWLFQGERICILMV